MALEIGDHHLAEIGRQAETGYPEEICGLLLGRCDGRDRRVLRILPCGNLERERAGDRYELDPAGQLRAEVEARREGLEVVGVYHSHPDHPPVPSAIDRERAVAIWEELESWSYLILEVSAGRAASPRSWVLRGGRFEEEAIIRSAGRERAPRESSTGAEGKR